MSREGQLWELFMVSLQQRARETAAAELGLSLCVPALLGVGQAGYRAEVRGSKMD